MNQSSLAALPWSGSNRLLLAAPVCPQEAEERAGSHAWEPSRSPGSPQDDEATHRASAGAAELI